MTAAAVQTKPRTVAGDRLRIAFGKNPLEIASMRNLPCALDVCRGGRQSLIVRTPQRISDPTFLTELESAETLEDGLRIVLTDPTQAFRARLDILVTGEGLAHRLSVTGPEPIWMVEWRLSGLRLDEVVIPALGGQSLGARMPSETTLTYKYPFWWNAQFVLGTTKGGGLWLRTKDVHPVFKLVRVKKSGGTFTLSYGIEADAPLTSNCLDATWYLDCFKGSWKVPAEKHRLWMENAFGLKRLDQNPFFPPWARQINFVLEMWGIGKEYPEPLHTFDQMVLRMKRWAKLHDPSRTLVYLPGYAEHGIDSRAPEYNPSNELGGETKFKELMDTAHRLGYRVMIHTNALCMTFTHPLYEQFKQYQVVDAFDRLQGWALDIDGDWLAEPYFAYINPGAREWGELMEKVIGDLIRKYGVDAVFLDQTLLAFNVSRGPNFVTGMREHILRLQQAFPDTLLAGEGLHEQVLSALPMVQIHGIDSLSEVHGLEGRMPWRKAHPVSTYLFGPYTRFTAHLLTRHPTHHMFKLQEAAYARLGVIPALCLYNSSQELDTPEVRSMIRRANRL